MGLKESLHSRTLKEPPFISILENGETSYGTPKGHRFALKIK